MEEMRMKKKAWRSTTDSCFNILSSKQCYILHSSSLSLVAQHAIMHWLPPSLNVYSGGQQDHFEDWDLEKKLHSSASKELDHRWLSLQLLLQMSRNSWKRHKAKLKNKQTQDFLFQIAFHLNSCIVASRYTQDLWYTKTCFIRSYNLLFT